MSTASIKKAIGSIDELTRLVGAPVSLVSVVYNFTDGVVTNSSHTLASAASNFGPDVVGQSVPAISGKIPGGTTVASRTDAHTLILSASTADGAALTGLVVGTDLTQPGSTKTVSAGVPLAALQSALSEYVDEDQNQLPQNAEEMLKAYVLRANNVIDGLDTFSAPDIQQILAWFLIYEHGA